ncbi:1,4-dihydroxy-2-naphthoate polyprenyltransferase [Levilactobacillus brevis]|uniref:1,4-dihydroxy-2-naphthoate polyprenyltransferase n=1 Tax=Levilactobacillus brevis TaxID=1580 RepID=UPI001144FCE5|nr:1,4-dihydroxy-2-naphthoate polyprenyltransferase [Levilactobacillus brevis]MBU7540216.1 1,4-dihydroxy-2-naphthoate polyprenyltransferase [Levilactobacillus brevis]MBU7558597.1 1,4-dihydroxy-2-naphthoate polyprenyltransferase [Levilactobacillus brevis]MBU7566344.1 1,4-dihydroxy-2-naphthoate polyprenyltransferase [Levilactobacillus brevis]MCE6010127.1 1,4-dihydroxy-2-naphthoate polyprenyltransferase [Levilactobacillus brevis]MCE6011990.1 1,4-dihydroxy-2-naphthoate polyprenyltransferase [Levil
MTLPIFLELVEIKAKIASVWPFLLGVIFVQANYGQLNWGITGLFFIAMLLFNMAVDINDNYQDYTKAGSQAAEWKKNTNIIGVNGLSVKRIFGLMATMAGVAGVIGLYLVWQTGWPLLVMGIFCFLVGYLYAGGPRPLSGTPTGEFFAGFTMGYMIMLITVYLNLYQTGNFTGSLLLRVLLASGIAVMAIAALLLANNICDAQEDLDLNRTTIVYYLGVNGSLWLFASFYVIGYGSLVASVWLGDLPRWSLLALVSVPLIYRNVRGLFQKQVKKETFILAVRSLGILALTTVLAELLGLWLG